MMPLAVSAVRLFATLRCRLRVTITAEDVATRTRESLSGGMTHCRDTYTGTDHLSGYSASCLFVDCTLILCLLP